MSYWEERREKQLGISKSGSMELCILSWNVRGINEGDKHGVINSLIRSHSVDLVCLEETKVQRMSASLVRSLGVDRCLEWGGSGS
ncbi:hypothetical protein CK203_038533 [Vitis vinifera]|uniref:Endonuclease/exonuclease/phosphatase domain-containing protein n=1 Tax=Vitis vinifera TaxID=29760 RepID=A0A438I401_VITVI|nr:hypothetical protein CK203_038533 [Vitis vinifera]